MSNKEPVYLTTLEDFESDYLPKGDYEVFRGTYLDGDTPALLLVYYGEPAATATVKLGVEPSEGCVWFKSWSGNEGLLEGLVERGVIELTGKTTQAGYAEAQEGRILLTPQ